MAQVLRSTEARCGIEVLRTESEVVMAVLDSDCCIALKSHPLVWAEVGEQYRDGRHIFNFDEVWRPFHRFGPAGIEPYPVEEATRKFIRGCFSAPAGFKGGALDALMDVLPQGEVHLFVRGVGFIGRFASLEDCQMIAGALKVDRPIIFGSPEELLTLTDLDLSEVVAHLDPEFRWPSKFKLNHATGVFEMAKKAARKKAAKVEKAEAAQRRADGPVAKAREAFEKVYAANHDATSGDYVAACEALNINRGTATTQLGRWRKEKGIAVKRGGARPKKEGADKTPSAATAKASKGKKGKGKKKDKPEPPKQPGLPAAAKGAKRHKPAASSPSPTDKADKSPASPPASASPAAATSGATTHSVSVTSASASTPGASVAQPVSTSAAAASQTAAQPTPPKK